MYSWPTAGRCATDVAGKLPATAGWQPALPPKKSNNAAQRTQLDCKMHDENLLPMKIYLRRTSVIALFLFATFLVSSGRGENPKPSVTLKITSSAFQEGGEIPAKFSRNGGNVNPPLEISGTPAAAKSLVLIVDDPDAPVGLFTHWLVWNIDSKTTKIAEHSVPAGAVQGSNDFPGAGYDGPQPPSGTHRYYFKVFALDQTLDLRAGAKRKELEAAMSGHVIAQEQLMGRFTKK
jgi:Raf kinase inhibitor-like YbhB/YbcL family protein